MELVSEIGEQSEVAGLFDGLANAALVLEAGSGQAAGQNLALLVDQHQQEIRVLIVNVLEALFTKAAVALAFGVNRDGIQVTDVLVCSHDRMV